jgi:heptaprenyl diphosphate synthase
MKTLEHSNEPRSSEGSPLELYRQARRKAYEDLFGPNALAAAGLAIMPALLFNPSTPLRVLLFLFFWFLAALAGKKNSPFLTLSVILGIVAFNLIVPYGRVLFTVGPLKITQGALAAGIHRAVTLEALIMLSRLAIRSDLRIPGLFGSLIGESFRMFALLMNQKRRITGKTFIADIDSLLFELSGDDRTVSEPDPKKTSDADADKSAKTKPAGYVVLVVVVILSWAPMFLDYLRI